MAMHNTIYAIAFVISCATFAQAQWTPDPFCPYPSDHVTRYPYYGNCSVYWECFEGSKYVMECPEGLEFNAPLQQCDDPSIANCDPFASTTDNPNTPTYTTTEGTPFTPDPLCPFPSDEITFFPYPGDCTKFYECFEGVKTEEQCPDDLWWHDEISNCDYPGDYCSDGSTGQPSTTTTTSPGTTSTEPDVDPRCVDGSTNYWQHPTDCHRYIECYKGNSYDLSCPPKLYFSEEKRGCVDADESECCVEKPDTCTE